MSQKPKAVLFDVDGMVLHGERFSDKYEKEFDLPPGSMKPFFEGPYEQCVIGKADLKQELAGWLERWKWQGTVQALMDYWFNSGNTLDTDVIESVKKLRSAGIICVLTTNQTTYRAAYIWDELGLREHFNKLMSSGDVGVKKPDPKFFESVMSYLQEHDPSIQPADVLFWDDRKHYVQGAEDFGFRGEVFTDFISYHKRMMELGLLN